MCPIATHATGGEIIIIGEGFANHKMLDDAGELPAVNTKIPYAPNITF